MGCGVKLLLMRGEVDGGSGGGNGHLGTRGAVLGFIVAAYIY